MKELKTKAEKLFSQNETELLEELFKFDLGQLKQFHNLPLEKANNNREKEYQIFAILVLSNTEHRRKEACRQAMSVINQVKM